MTATECLQAAVDTALKGIASHHTHRAYERHYSALLAWFQGSGLPDIDKHAIEAYLDDLAAKGAQPATVNQSLAAIRKLADVDERFAIFKTIKARKNPRSNANAHQPKKRTLGKREIQKLLDATNAKAVRGLRDKAVRGLRDKAVRGLRDRALLALLIGCGLKREEIASLTFEQIGKAQGQPIIRLEGRTVPIPAWAKRALDAYKRKANLKQGRVFLSTAKTGELLSDPLNERSITKIVVAYGVKAHIGPNITPADLRRSFAILAYERGTPIEEIQTLLGHDSIQNTRRLLLLGVESQPTLQRSPGDRFGIKI